jgi:dTDP-4-amino-4,6-dideoxygalactose transaminase
MSSINRNEIPLLPEDSGNIPLFWPHIPSGAAEAVIDTLNSRWIGQGPKVDRFESEFSSKFCSGDPGIAVGSGTDALHLAYLLAGVEPEDEVIVPVFTCTATNIPLLYIGAKIVFADVVPETMNIDLDHVTRLLTNKTKAVVVVHYGGQTVDVEKLKQIIGDRQIKIIEDAAHALGSQLRGKPVGTLSDFTMFSFQAIKHVTTGDGGYLSFKDKSLLAKAKRLRWFGINREDKQKGIWENDIVDIGYKYQMTDISAAIGLCGLAEFDQTLSFRKELFMHYADGLRGIPGLKIIGDLERLDDHGAWLFSIHVEGRRQLQEKLFLEGVESNQVHYRNDRYSIFGGRRKNLPQMDLVEDTYLVLPLHTKMTLGKIDRVIEIIRSGW